MLKVAMTRTQLLAKGYTKADIRKLVSEGKLIESFGKFPGTDQIVRCYQWRKNEECQSPA